MLQHILLQSIRPIYPFNLQYGDLVNCGNKILIYCNNKLQYSIVGEELFLNAIWLIAEHDKILWKLSDSDKHEIITILREYTKIYKEDDE